MPSGRFAKDLTGQRFGKLFVLGRLPNTPKGMAKWQCRCDCGGKSSPLTSGLIRKGTISCGCHRLTVISKLKLCAKCDQWKLHKEFSLTNRKKPKGDRFGPYCKGCAKEIKRIAYLANPFPAIRRAQAINRIERQAVLDAYGRQCACCGEDNERFLEIDHIDNGGNRHRKQLKSANGGRHYSFYRWLRENGYPAGYQTLCSNCNIGKYRNGGFCPHTDIHLVAALSFGG